METRIQLGGICKFRIWRLQSHRQSASKFVFTTMIMSMVFATCVTAFASNTVFDARIAYPGGNRTIEAVDLDSDGFQDIVRVSRDPFYLICLLNDGTGRFTESYRVPVPGDIIELRQADFNNDGWTDLATREFSLLFLNDRMGGFEPPRNFSTWDRNYANLLPANVNGDEFTDLICKRSAQVFELLLNLGNGAFATDTLMTITGFYAYTETACDLDGDSSDELVVTDLGTIRVFGNDGDGHFGPASTMLKAAGMAFVEAHDMDGDSQQDLCLVYYDNGQVEIRLNSDGALSPPLTPDVSLTGLGNYSFGDLDGDGDLDLKIEGPMEIDFEGVVSIRHVSGLLENNGLGQLSVKRLLNVPGTPGKLADLDGDKMADLLYASCCSPDSSGVITIHWNHGNWRFSLVDQTEIPLAPQDLESADMNLDGRPDLITANFGLKSIGIALGDGAGGFSRISVCPTGVWTQYICPGDFDGDGFADIAAISSDTQELTIYQNDRSGGLNAWRSYLPENRPKDLISADIDADGYEDLVVICHRFPEGGLYIYHNDGPESGFSRSEVNTVLGVGAVASGNFDNDNTLELAVAIGGEREDCQLLIFDRDETGTFIEIASHSVGDSPFSLAIADFNADGLADIAVGCAKPPRVDILLNTEHGNLIASTSIMLGQLAAQIGAKDYNLDGHIDLFSGSRLLLGNGEGSFERENDYITIGLGDRAEADFDLDGDVDFVSYNQHHKLLAFNSNLSRWEPLCGDLDGNRFVSISDIVYFIAYLFSGGPAPVQQSADINCDGRVNLTDAVYGINFIFLAGPAPCQACS